MVYSNTIYSQWGEMSMVCPVNCLIIFTFFEALNDAFEVQFFHGYILYHNDSMHGHAAQIS